MLREFAIEPTVLDCWSRCEYFMADCGIESGRLVSEFPLFHWKKRVWQAVIDNPKRTPRDEQKVQYHLQHTADAKLVYTARSYHFKENAPPWLDQALREHASMPFSAIISSAKAEGKPHVIQVDEFDKHDVVAWQVNATCPIDRTPEAIAALTNLLCRGADLVKLFDPHFDSGENRF